MPGRSHCPALSASRWGRWRADRYAVCAAPGTMSSCPIPGRSFALTTGLLPAWRPRATPARLAQTFFAEADVALQAGATGARSFTRRRRGRKARQRVGAATRCLHNKRGSSPVVQMLSGGLVGQREPEAGRVVERWAQRLHILCLQRRHMDRPVAVVTITVGDQCVEHEVGRKRGTWVGALGRQVLRTEQAPAGSPRRCAHVARDRPGRS